jgi:hypothetical protein
MKNNKSIERVQVLGVYPKLAHYTLDHQEALTYLYERSDIPETLYSILIVYQDGTREIKDGLFAKQLKPYLPYIQ